MARLRCSLYVRMVTERFIYLEDQDGQVSMTNDAENVVAWAHERYPGRRVMYQDTMGRWDEMMHEEGSFTRFAPGHEPGHAPEA